MDITKKILLICLFIIAINSCARAEDIDENIFAIKNMGVQKESDTFYNAKTSAIQQGLSSGINQVLYTVIPYNFYGQLKEISIEDPNLYVEDFQVYNEDIGKNTYKAKLDVKYKASAIKSLLDNNNIPYKFQLAPRILLVPILIKNNKISLWQNNSWDKAWDKAPSQLGLTKINLAMGDLEDNQVVNVKNAHDLNYNQIQSLLQKYNSDIAAILTCNEDLSGYSISLRLLTPTGEENKYMYYKAKRSYTPIITDILLKLDAEWKGEKTFQNDLQLATEVNFEYNNLIEWVEAQKSLKKLPNISDFSVLSIKKNNVAIEIKHNIDLELLTIYLNEEGLILSQNDGYLSLRKRNA